MEDFVLYSFLSLLFLLLAYILYRSNSSGPTNLPPSPPSLPIVGHLHLHLLKPPIHRVFHGLSRTYGPIFSLKFGSQLTVVVSSPSLVEECFTKNDVVLANRPKTMMTQHLDYNHSTLVASPYGDHWRNLRRIGSNDIFAPHRLNVFLFVRRDETRRLITRLARDSYDKFAKVEMKTLFSDLTFNVIMRMVAGKRYYGDDVTNKEEANEFKELIDEVFKYAGASNLEDFFPVAKLFTGRRYEKKVKSIAKRSDKLLQGFIDEHRSKKREGKAETMVDHLISLRKSQPDYYTDEIIKGLIMNMLLAGTDTSATTLEWALSNLVNHPEILEKAKGELDSEIGQDQLLDEPDLSKLPYLHNIISESLRLYPVAPLLVPHSSSNDCIIGGHNIPKDTILLVNAWSIHRDPEIWEEPTTFKPERFGKEGKVDNHKMMPFGTGRRACPGAGLARRVLGLTLGSLIQSFEWKRLDQKLVNMDEGEGLSMHKAEPLEVYCKARPIVAKYFP